MHAYAIYWIALSLHLEIFSGLWPRPAFGCPSFSNICRYCNPRNCLWSMTMRHSRNYPWN